MEHNNSLNKDIKIDDDNPGLSYETHQEQAICISKAADLPTTYWTNMFWLNTLLQAHLMIKLHTLS